MGEVFISYAREDLSRIRPLVELLQQEGYSVWWDRRIAPGSSFDEIIERAIEAARCVVVVWSEHSAQSRWVRAEAEEGRQRGILVPVQIDIAKIPLAFRSIQAAQLQDWTGARDESEARRLVEAVASVVGPGTRAAPAQDRPDATASVSNRIRVVQVPELSVDTERPPPRGDGPAAPEHPAPPVVEPVVARERGAPVLPRLALATAAAALLAGLLETMAVSVWTVFVPWLDSSIHGRSFHAYLTQHPFRLDFEGQPIAWALSRSVRWSALALVILLAFRKTLDSGRHRVWRSTCLVGLGATIGGLGQYVLGLLPIVWLASAAGTSWLYGCLCAAAVIGLGRGLAGARGASWWRPPIFAALGAAVGDAAGGFLWAAAESTPIRALTSWCLDPAVFLGALCGFLLFGLTKHVALTGRQIFVVTGWAVMARLVSGSVVYSLVGDLFGQEIAFDSFGAEFQTLGVALLSLVLEYTFVVTAVAFALRRSGALPRAARAERTSV